LIPPFPHISLKRLTLSMLFIAVCYLVITANPDIRNERVECLSLNNYSETPVSGHTINTGLISLWLYKVFPYYKILALLFWAGVFYSIRNCDNWLLIGAFTLIALRCAHYQHEEAYFGMPLVYMSYMSNNKWIKGISMGLAMTIRPVYLAFMLPYYKNEWVWGISTGIFAIAYLTAIFTMDYFITYNPILNLFRGGMEINYAFWFLDYMLFIILPLMWVEEME
jgi:hypothetical protein